MLFGRKQSAYHIVDSREARKTFLSSTITLIKVRKGRESIFRGQLSQHTGGGRKPEKRFFLSLHLPKLLKKRTFPPALFIPIETFFSSRRRRLIQQLDFIIEGRRIKMFSDWDLFNAVRQWEDVRKRRRIFPRESSSQVEWVVTAWLACCKDQTEEKKSVQNRY